MLLRFVTMRNKPALSFLVARNSSTEVSRILLRFPEVRSRRWPPSGVSEMKSESGLWKALVGKGEERKIKMTQDSLLFLRLFDPGILHEKGKKSVSLLSTS